MAVWAHDPAEYNEPTPPTPERILRTGLGFWASKLLLSRRSRSACSVRLAAVRSFAASVAELGLHHPAAHDSSTPLWHGSSDPQRRRGYAHPETDLFLDLRQSRR